MLGKMALAKFMISLWAGVGEILQIGTENKCKCKEGAGIFKTTEYLGQVPLVLNINFNCKLQR